MILSRCKPGWEGGTHTRTRIKAVIRWWPLWSVTFTDGICAECLTGFRARVKNNVRAIR